MLVQPSRTATVCEVDRARKRAASRKRAQNLGCRTNRWRLKTHLTATCSCEACSAFTRVAARTLAQSPICDELHRGLQPFRHLHDCSGCFRLERLPGGACTHWNAPPSHGAHVNRTLRIGAMDVAVGRRARLHWLPRERPELALKLPLRCERRWSQSQSSPFVATAATLHGNRRLRLARNT